MTTLVIPDVHENVPQLIKILKAYPQADEIVFLGDFFDTYNPSHKHLELTCELLESFNERDDVHLLLGNHDAQYRFPYKVFRCSGFDEQKLQILKDVNMNKLKLMHITQGWVLTHAGIHPSMLHPVLGLDENYMKLECLSAVLLACAGVDHPFMKAGVSRGGDAVYGGLTWLDWNEFEPIPGVNQIVGHSHSKKVRENSIATSQNFCIDTGLQHVALIVDGVVHIEEV
jgi:predicted phosphodiesterase